MKYSKLQDTLHDSIKFSPCSNMSVTDDVNYPPHSVGADQEALFKPNMVHRTPSPSLAPDSRAAFPSHATHFALFSYYHVQQLHLSQAVAYDLKRFILLMVMAATRRGRHSNAHRTGPLRNQ